MRKAWYAFSRLLDIPIDESFAPIDESFACENCGPCPDIIVCDGTMIGMRKDLMLPIKNCDLDESKLAPIKGSSHVDRVLIKTKKARDLLLQYSCFKRDRKPIVCPQKLTDVEFKQLTEILHSDGFIALEKLLLKIEDEHQEKLAPVLYRRFFSEIARNAPACGMVQIAGCKEACDTLKKVANRSIDVFMPQNSYYWNLLSKKAPVISSFLSLCHQHISSEIPQEVFDLLGHISVTIQAPFKVSKADKFHYPEPNRTNSLSYFPSLPQLHGNAVYQIDKSRIAAGSDVCNKTSSKHPTLTPGIFTVYCPHTICYGFEVLKECESPRHPFQIFKTSFLKPPKIIVYDNACGLHQYCLNREPVFFQNTSFYVDRFHWRGHVGCPSGYCLDQYNTLDTKSLNSQVMSKQMLVCSESRDNLHI